MMPRDLAQNLSSYLADKDEETILTILMQVEEWLHERHFGLASQDVRMAITNLARSRQWRGARRN